MSTFIGIDLGTTNLKILLFSLEKGIIDFESEKIKSFQEKEGYHEQDPSEWIKKTIRMLKILIKRNKSYVSDIKAIGFSGQMHGLVVIDEEGDLLRPCMTWVDQRAKFESKYVSENIDIFELTGNLSNPSFTLPKILWLKNKESKNYKNAKCFFQPKDYLRYALGKNKPLVTDKTDASATLLMDIKNQNWSKEIIETFDLDIKKLPEIKNSYEIVDIVREDIAQELGLKSDVYLIAGAGDQEAAAVGLGINEENEEFISCGTAAQILRPTFNPILNKDCGLHLFCHPLNGWHYLGALQNAGNVLDWALKCLNLDYSDIEQISGKEGNNLYFLPYLTGERTPIMDEDARGVWIGLNISHTKIDMLTSVLEGIAFSIKLAHEKITNILGEEKVSYFIGGAAKSNKWSQIIANVVGRELLTLKLYEGSAYGAALLAAMGSESITIKELSKYIPETKKIIIPIDKIFNYYQTKFGKFSKLVQLEKAFRNY